MKYQFLVFTFSDRSIQILQPVYRIDCCVEDLLHFMIAKFFLFFQIKQDEHNYDSNKDVF